MQVVLLTVSRYHDCRYCMAAHSMSARRQGVPEQVVEALRTDQPIHDPKLEMLRVTTNKLLEQRGWLTEREVDAFLDAGFESRQLLDVLVGLAMKTLSNYTNHLAHTPLDKPMSPYAWTPPSNDRL